MTLSTDGMRPARLQRVAPSDPAKAWRREQGLAHRVRAEKLRRITQAVDEGRSAWRLVRETMRNRLVRLSALLSGMGENPDRDEAYTLLDRVDAWSDAWPPIPWYLEPKPSGGMRPICILPPELAATHRIIAAVIEAQLRPRLSLYGIRGRGRDDAARQVQAWQRAGLTCLAKTDLVNCFATVGPPALEQLPLPMEVPLKTLDARSLTFIHMDEPGRSYRSCFLGNDQQHLSGPRGLIQGSPASSIISAWLLNELPSCEDPQVLICFDNIVVADRDEDGCRAKIATLADELRRCPAGPLELCPPTFIDSEGLEFLSYLFPPGGRRSVSRTVRSPSSRGVSAKRTRFIRPTWKSTS